MAASHDTKRKIAQGKAVLPKFAISDFVLYARVRGQGVTEVDVHMDWSVACGRI